MRRHLGILAATIALGTVWTAGSAQAAPPPKAPPAPPVAVTKFPKPTSKPPVPRIIHLKPGQKVITREQLLKAPTVYVANRRQSTRSPKPASGPEGLQIPGSPQLTHKLPLYPLKSTGPKPAPKQRAASPKPRK